MRLNLDAGELPDELPELWAHFDILNIACGGHAGDTASMTRVVAYCVAHSIAIGAHPSYPDRDHFGRRTLDIDAEDLHASLVSQLRALSRIALAHDARVQYAKPHGALYHDASRDPALAVLVVDAIRTALDEQVTIIGPRGHLASAARAAGLAYAVEGFADRRMRADGSLVPRSEPDALITSPSATAAQALSLSDVDTICVHADTPGSLEIARAVRMALGNVSASNASASDAARSSAPASNATASNATTSNATASNGSASSASASNVSASNASASNAIASSTARSNALASGAPSVLTSAKSNAPPSSEPLFVALGDRAVRFPRPRSSSPRALVDAIRRWPGVVDVVVARHDVAAYFGLPLDRAGANESLSLDLERSIARLADLGDTNEPVREIELFTIYDGPDLDEVARTCGLTTTEVITAHVGATYEVDTMGFAPGFAYLAGLDPRLHVARRASPRERVPAGTLAIAGEYTAVYPFASPGGWNLIGRVDEKMFDPDRGARLQLGDRVRFTRA